MANARWKPADYEANLRSLVATLKATGAKLIWASTTPIPEGELNPPRKFGQVKEYNEIAEGDEGERRGHQRSECLDDATLRGVHKPKDLHYSDAGSEFLAQKVATAITAALSK
jgi:hypothetical protein